MKAETASPLNIKAWSTLGARIIILLERAIMIDLEELGYFLFMEVEERKQKEEQSEEEEDSGGGL